MKKMMLVALVAAGFSLPMLSFAAPMSGASASAMSAAAEDAGLPADAVGMGMDGDSNDGMTLADASDLGGMDAGAELDGPSFVDGQ